jgi:hypothetical protein
VPLTVAELERLNEWAAEVDAPAAIGQALLACAGAMGHIPVDAPARIREAVPQLDRDRDGSDPDPRGGVMGWGTRQSRPQARRPRARRAARVGDYLVPNAVQTRERA